MTYLIPVYAGKDQGFVGGDFNDQEDGVPLIRIGGFKGADFLKSHRFQATGTAQVAATPNINRRTITVRNEGANDVFIGGEDVTPSTGYRLGTTESITLELAGELWCITNGTSEFLFMISEIDG